jgi:Na+/phosphate symporter
MAELFRKLLARFGPFVVGAILLTVYLQLPDPSAPEASVDNEPAPNTSERLEIVDVRPLDPTPNSAVVIRYAGASEVQGATLGKEPMTLLERPPGALVARLPADIGVGYHKIRLQDVEGRSKPFRIKVEAVDWRKRFRNLVGGLALVLFGLELLSRAVREATGLDSAAKLARIAVRRDASFAFGGLVGALVQSTSSVAGLLGALVATNLLGLTAAGAAFLGAELASGVAPFLLTSVVAPNEGLIAVALGVVWMRFATDRRQKALGRLVLGAGVMAFGLHVLRPGFEPLLSEPLLITLLDGFQGHGLVPTLNCIALGVGLSALLQGPAPVLLLVVSLAETTGLWDFRSAMMVVSGSGLGAALASTLALPRASHEKGLGILNLCIGFASTLIGALGVPVWCSLSDWLVRGYPHQMDWGERVLLPNIGLHLVLAFAIAQISASLVVLPMMPPLARFLEQRAERRRRSRDGEGARFLERLHEGLSHVLRAERRALDPIAELALSGRRSLSRHAEREIAEARRALDGLLTAPASPDEKVGADELQRALLNCLQLHSAIEMLLRETDRLVEARLTTTRVEGDPSLPPVEQAALREMQRLLGDGLDDLIGSLSSGIPLDIDQSRAREIRLNTVEAELRSSLSLDRLEVSQRKVELGVLSWAGTCELAGNHVYRLGQTLSDLCELGVLPSLAAPAELHP